MNGKPPASKRPESPEENYRLYIDESGDHVFKKLENPAHRYLCLLGCWFKGAEYKRFHLALEAFKERHLPHNPDEPVILHREDMINRRGAFWRLRDPGANEAFDNDLLATISSAEFRIVAVVVDKLALQQFPAPAHPYHLAIGFMLQRYCGFLNHINRRGDVMAESRGGTEDKYLKESYTRHYELGAWQTRAEVFQQALTTRELKLKTKSANIAGLQLADLLGHPIRQHMLVARGLVTNPLAPFAQRLMQTAEQKFNRHLYKGRVEGYGMVFYPK